jgi:hypothetical protein
MAPNELLGLQPVAGQRALRSSAHPAQSDRQWPLGPGTANLTWAQEIQGLLACVLTPRARQELWHSFTTSVGIPQNTAADREMARALYVSLRVLVGRTLAAAAALERSLDRDSVERRRAGRAGFRPRTRHLPRGARRGAEAVPPLPLGGPGGGGAAARVDPALDPRLPGPPGGRDPESRTRTGPRRRRKRRQATRSPARPRRSGRWTLDCILIRRIRFHSIRSSVVAHTGPQGCPCRRGRQRPASRRQHRRSRCSGRTGTGHAVRPPPAVADWCPRPMARPPSLTDASATLSRRQVWHRAAAGRLPTRNRRRQRRRSSPGR